jgi:formylglycine-generating enzyme required for sulfatase activity
MTHSIGMKLVWIPPGEFMMGSPSSEEGRDDDEGPVHRVKISKGFYMGQTEVTQRQWEAVMRNNPSDFEGSDLPVENVSWDDAVEFCNKLSRKEGKKYRLPTEAEWEYACRAGTSSAYNWGDSWQRGVCNAENDVGSSEDSNVEIFRRRGLPVDSTVPVGSFQPNAFGLYDMHGNVWEWCNDWYDEDYYSQSPIVDPQGPSSGTYRVLRGGSWFSTPGYCRSAPRLRYSPGYRNSVSGFRVVFLDF